MTRSGTRSEPAPRQPRRRTTSTCSTRNDPTAGKQATLIQSAIDSKVDGIATTLSTRTRSAGSVQAAIDAGIPVVGFNAGIDQYEELGALMYFGSDETLAGEAAGERITEAGGAAPALRHPGSRLGRAGGPLRRRVKANAPATENIQVNGADLPSVTSTLAAKLQQDPVDRLHRHAGCADRHGGAGRRRPGRQRG